MKTTNFYNRTKIEADLSYLAVLYFGACLISSSFTIFVRLSNGARIRVTVGSYIILYLAVLGSATWRAWRRSRPPRLYYGRAGWDERDNAIYPNGKHWIDRVFDCI